MIKLFSLGKKKEEKAETPADDMLFAELQKIKEEIEKGSSPNISNLFGEMPSSSVTSAPNMPQPRQAAAQQQMPQQLPMPLSSSNVPAPQAAPQQPQTLLPPPQQYQPQPTPQPSTTLREEESFHPPEHERYEEHHKEEKAELYIKIDHYEKVLDILDRLKVKLKDLEHIINELKDIKEQENIKLEEMRDQLETTKENINDVLSLLKQ